MVGSNEIKALQEILLIAQKAKADADKSGDALEAIEAIAVRSVVEYFSRRIFG
jgi:hypothetical protein